MLDPTKIRKRVTVNFTLNGESGSVEMIEPNIGVASELRKNLMKAAKLEQNDDADALGELNLVLSQCVKECVPSDQCSSKLTDEDWISFVNRTGGAKSPPVREALKLCGFTNQPSEEVDSTPF